MDNFGEILIKWYQDNKRDLPWRRTKNPYLIWISEIILQQTRVAQGYDYYQRFVKRFPDVFSLAAADEDEVMKYWQGLGYYSRARNLHAAARSMAGAGGFPKTYKEVLALKEEIANKQKTAIGRAFLDFSMTTPEGKNLSVSAVAKDAKVTMIDFWASWCGPCRAEIPHLKQYYEEFKNNKEVAFLSVSIDTKRPDWEKAMKEENMPWLQLLAPNSGKEVLESYQFSGIPFIIVLDKEGKIYKKRLRGEAVRDAVNEVLSGKKAEAPKAIGGGTVMSMGAAM